MSQACVLYFAWCSQYQAKCMKERLMQLILLHTASKFILFCTGVLYCIIHERIVILIAWVYLKSRGWQVAFRLPLAPAPWWVIAYHHHHHHQRTEFNMFYTVHLFTHILTWSVHMNVDAEMSLFIEYSQCALWLGENNGQLLTWHIFSHVHYYCSYYSTALYLLYHVLKLHRRKSASIVLCFLHHSITFYLVLRVPILLGLASARETT